MPIAAIESTAVAVPLSVPTRISTRLLDAREYLIVRVISTDTADGYGYSYIGTTGGLTARQAVDELLAPVVVGRSVFEPQELWADLYQSVLLSGRRGIVLRAMSAIDIALHDAAATTRNISLARFLGGDATSVPAYASGGYYRDGDPMASVEDEIALNVSEGFRDHKIKVGGASLDMDAQRVRVAIEAIGRPGRLAVDANNAYATASEAILAGRAFEKAAGSAGLWWFEEPLSPEDVAGHAAVASALDTPIAIGEIHQTRWDFAPIFEQKAASIIQVDAGVVGGISEWRRVASMARERKLLVAPHWSANLHVPLVAATPGCLAVEHFSLEKDIFNFERLLTSESRLEPDKGRLPVPTRPGIGFEFDQDAVTRYSLP